MHAVSVYEYLHTDYSPDCDYVDGKLEERNVGEWDHANLQTLLAAYILRHSRQWGIRVVVEQRIQISPTRYRVPDITVVRQRPAGGIITEPPLLCIEILSPEDRVAKVQRRVDDYLRLGVPWVWVVDPKDRRAWIWTEEGSREAKDGLLIAGPVCVPLAEIEE